jgi:formylglycine-generating enzyme required for sulfatase activity
MRLTGGFFMNTYAKQIFNLRALTVIATLGLGYSQSGAPKPQAAVNPVKTNPKDGLTYVWIPPGTFMMGCSPGDGPCTSFEMPAHKVTITKGFWIGQTEVTQTAYERVVGSNPSQVKGASLPVVNISWDDAEAYCKAVGMRLPTEAEWEYAARGGNPSARYGKLDAVAWYSANSGDKTHEVGQKQANAYGLFDMLGNVAEWVADWFDEKYYASSPVNDPQRTYIVDEPLTMMSGMVGQGLRGGAESTFGRDTRASWRGGAPPSVGYNNVGVRCAGN